MNLLKDLPLGSKSPDEINAVIENVKGSNNKIEYDNVTCVFKLDRVLHSAVFWPFEYGFLPQTWHDDNDPVDVVVFTTYPTFTGCVMKVRPIGLIVMKDEAGVDDKVIAVPVKDPRFANVRSVKDVPEHVIKEMQEFFETYKRLEPGKFVKLERIEDADKAKAVIRRGAEAFKAKFK